MAGTRTRMGMANMDAVARLLRLLHLASPALPVGAFAWSQGLGGAVEQGLVRDGAGLQEWCAVALDAALARWDAPLLLRCAEAARREDAAAFARWNALSLAGRETAELWQEEQHMGKALCRLLRDMRLLPVWYASAETGAEKSVKIDGKTGAEKGAEKGGKTGSETRVRTAADTGYVAAFALAAVATGAYSGREHARALAAAFLWSWLENQTAAACKAVPLGQTAAQAVLLALMPAVEHAADTAAALPDTELGACLHGLALVSAAHEQQYSRLFRS